FFDLTPTRKPSASQIMPDTQVSPIPVSSSRYRPAPPALLTRVACHCQTVPSLPVRLPLRAALPATASRRTPSALTAAQAPWSLTWPCHQREAAPLNSLSSLQA